jgi:MFS family permease
MIKRENAGFALAVLFSINAMNFYDRLIPAAVTQPMKKEWLLTDLQIGAFGTAFTLLYAAVGIPLGRLTDRFSRRRLLATGVFAWSLLTAASGLARNFTQLFILRLAVGVGEATCAPASTSLIGDLYPAKRRARALSIFMLGLPIGNALCFFVSGWVTAKWHWQAAFYVALIPGLLCAMGAWLISEPQRGAAEARNIGARTRAGSPYWLVLKTPTMVWIILSGALHNFNMYALGSFLMPFLQRVHGCELRTASLMSTCIYGLSGVPGLFIGGMLGDRVSRTNGRMIVAASAIALAIPLLTFGLLAGAGELTAVAALLTGGCMLLYMYYSTVYSTIQDVVEPSLRGTAMALYFFAMYLLGGALGPIVMGALSDHFARQAAHADNINLEGLSRADVVKMLEPYDGIGLHSALFVIPILCTGLAAVLAAGARTVTADAEHLRRWMEESAGGPPAPEVLGSSPDMQSVPSRGQRDTL